MLFCFIFEAKSRNRQLMVDWLSVSITGYHSVMEGVKITFFKGFQPLDIDGLCIELPNGTAE